MKKSTLRRLAAALFAVIMIVSLVPAALAVSTDYSVSDTGWTNVTHGYTTAPSATYTVTNNTEEAMAYTVAITGTNSADFTPSKTAGNVAATVGSTDTFTVTFKTGATVGPYSATVTVTPSAPSGLTPDDSSISFSVLDSYTLEVTALDTWPTTLTLGDYDATTVIYSIENTGTGALTGITAVLTNDTDFHMNALPATTLAAGATTLCSVTFPAGKPAADYTDTLTVTSTEDATGDTADMSVSVVENYDVTVTGTWPTADVLAGHYTALEQTVTYTITNNGDTTITPTVVLDNLSSPGCFTKNTTGLSTIAAHTSGTFTVTLIAGLSASTTPYTADLTVSVGSQEVASFDLSRTVKESVTITFMNANATYDTKYVAKTTGHVTAPTINPTKAQDSQYTYEFEGWTTNATAVNASQNTYGFNGVTTLVTLSTATFNTDTTLYAVYTKHYRTAVGASGDCKLTTGQMLSEMKNTTSVSIDSQLMVNLRDGLGYSTLSSGKVIFGSQTGTIGALYTNSTQSVPVGSSAYSFGSALSQVFFKPIATTGTYQVSYTAEDTYGNSVGGTITITLKLNAGDITYDVGHDGVVAFSANDFSTYLQTTIPYATLYFVKFDAPSVVMGSTYGSIFYNYNQAGQVQFTNYNLANYEFYYSNSANGDYPLSGLTFVPGSYTGDYTITIDFDAYYGLYGSASVGGTLAINVSDKGTITYTVSHTGTAQFVNNDFDTYLRESYANYGVRWVTFESPDKTLGSYYGYIYRTISTTNKVSLSNSTLASYDFFAVAGYGDYPLNTLSFEPGSCPTDYTISIPFTAYYSNTTFREGTLELKVTEGDIVGCDIVYNTKSNIAVSITPADIESFFKETYPSLPLTYVTLGSVPATGDLYYNYGAMGNYGTTSALKLTSSNYDDYTFYKNPTNTSYYSLYELTYVPSGTNYTVVIPFTAYYNTTNYVSGTIVICVTSGTLSDVYTVTTKNVKATMSASAFYSAVSTATSSAVSYIQFLTLPASAEGTLYYSYTNSTNYGHKVATSNNYFYANGTYLLTNVSFVPGYNFTGNVTIPYAAYNSSGTLLCVGELSIGVVTTVKSYSDVTSSAWYYKYVTELSDSSVVNGYPNGTFKPTGNVTNGEALKLILIAAGYGVQARTSANAHWASGYLQKAVQLGIYTQAQANALNLNSAINRLEVARIAAIAMSLGTSSIASPFTDTNNTSVLALFQAGIIEGSFNSAGLRYYYPSNAISRAEISAIIWRINNYS